MMQAFRLMWTISRYFNTDEHMVPLMERVAWELAERVNRVVDVRELFKWGARMRDALEAY